MKFYYNGKQEIKDVRRWGNGNLKATDTYEYINGKMTKWLIDGKVIKEYKYDNQGNQIEDRCVDIHSIPAYYRYTYENGVNTRSQLFVADTIKRIDTFIYDNNKHLVEVYSYNNKEKNYDTG